jgi:hypothetical protein
MPAKKIKPTNKISKDSTLAEILEKKGADRILSDNRVPCMTCPMAQMELSSLKLENVCNMYGLDMEKILKELSKLK